MNLILKHREASSIDEYLQLPKEQRYYHGLYLVPFSMYWGEWTKFSRWAKQNHPIQYFFREIVCGFVSGLAFSFRMGWYEFKCWLRPHNKIILRDLPKTWSDKDIQIEAFLKQCLIDYVEKEKCFEIINFSETPQTEKQIRDLYDYFKNIVPVRKKQVDLLYEQIHATRKSLDLDDCFKPSPEKDRLYKQLDELEKEIEDELTAKLIEVIQIRRTLWT